MDVCLRRRQFEGCAGCMQGYLCDDARRTRRERVGTCAVIWGRHAYSAFTPPTFIQPSINARGEPLSQRPFKTYTSENIDPSSSCEYRQGVCTLPFVP